MARGSTTPGAWTLTCLLNTDEKDRSTRLIHNIPIDAAGEADTRDGFNSGESTADVVGDAYWYAAQLIDAGWLIRRVGITDGGGFFVAETPRRRVVSVDEHYRSETGPAAQFAKSITVLAAAGAAEGRDHLSDLVRLLAGHPPLRRPATLTWRTWPIPGIPGGLQPIPKIRAAYWFAVTLTDDYGWSLTEIGRPTAAGGFIANIPEETVAIFPSSMIDDGTVASALARLLGGISAAEVAVVAALVEWHSGVRYHEGRIR